MKNVFLLPGQLHVAKQPTTITTILGSCVAVVLFDETLKVGGINHYLIAEYPPYEKPSERYGAYSIPKLIEGMEALGSKKQNMVAKVYGGGKVIKTSGTVDIGTKNINKALEMLDEANIRIVEKDVGDNVSRKVVFNSSNFDVVLSRHESSMNSDLSGFKKAESKKEVSVGIVDDSATVRNLFTKAFSKNGIKVVGASANAYEAREMIVKGNPDVITLDIEMPHMSGVQFLEKLMKHKPMPVVMVSSLDNQGDAAYRALELGAIEFVQKPSQFDTKLLSNLGEMLANKVRAAASTSLIGKREKINFNRPTTPTKSLDTLSIVAIGGNTGSKPALTQLLKGLPEDTPPTVVCNPTLSAFLEAYIQDLKSGVKMSMRILEDNMPLTLGNLYFCPPEGHTVIQKKSGQFVAKIEKNSTPICNQMPSVTRLFDSISAVAGSESASILLGGFGNDGVRGMVSLRSKGGLTIVEDPSAAKFPHVPQEAITEGAVEHVLDVSGMISQLMTRRSQGAA